MRAHLVRTVLAVVVVSASACGSVEEVVDRAPAPRWSVVEATLTDRFDAASPNPCNRGASECLDVIIEEMERRFDVLLDTCDHNAPFALAYLTMTRALRDAAERTGPGEAAYLTHLDGVFADMYFDAYDAWKAGRRTEVPASWNQALDAAARKQVTGLGDLLAGMNAHITRDLAVAVAAVGLSLPDGSSAKPAFDLVNGVIGAVQTPMMAEQARRLDPTLGQVDLSLVAPAGTTVTELIALWREESWQSASRLVAATPADRPSVAAAIEQHADARALTVILGSSYVPLISSTAPRDEHCRVHGRDG